MRFLLIITALMTVACEPAAEAIRYGEDACSYCRMTIVGKQHGAELVTTKGKVFKFDAVECLVGELNRTEHDPALLLVTDFSSPESLITASAATYLISEAIPSPMGANLSAFASQTDAMDLARERGGELFTWQQLLEKQQQSPDSHHH